MKKIILLFLAISGIVQTAYSGPSVSKLNMPSKPPILSYDKTDDKLAKRSGATITAAQDGDYDAAATWVGGVVPTTGDIAIVPSGITVYVSFTIFNKIWNNPELRVYGVLQVTNSVSSDIKFTNNAPITIYNGGKWRGVNASGTRYLFAGDNRVAMKFEAGSSFTTGMSGTLLMNGDGFTNANYSLSLNFTPISGPFDIVLESGTIYKVATFASTALPQNITASTTTLGGTITTSESFNGERGIVWSTSPMPTIANNKVQIGTGSGTFSTAVSLPSGSTVYTRAYASLTDKTIYGAQESFTTGVNTAPTQLSLSNTTVAELVASQTAIGTFSATDSEGGAMTYAFANGTGDTDNGTFTIEGDVLKINASPDYETKNSYSILVKVSDSKGASYTKQFTISITDIDEVIKVVNVKVPDNGTYYYDGNSLQFEVNFSQRISFSGALGQISLKIKVGGTEKLATYTYHNTVDMLGFVYRPTTTDKDLDGIEILSLDLNGVSIAPTGYTIEPTLVNVGTTAGVLIETKPPTDIQLSSSSIRSGSAAGTRVAYLTGVDPQNDADSFALVTGNGDTDNGAFELVYNELFIKNIPDILVKSSYSIRIKVADRAGLTFEKQFTISVSPDITPSANKIIYVNHSVGGGNGVGDSWANAAPELAYALRWARKNVDNGLWDSTNPLQIWMAGGTYKPLFNAKDGEYEKNGGVDNAFVLVNNVQLYGGFAGTERSLAERDLAISTNKSVLSGEDGTVHVVIGSGNVNNSRLDGFTILPRTNFNSTSTISVNGLAIPRNYGGGIMLKSSSPLINNVVVEGTGTRPINGGVYLNQSNSVFNNVMIDGNSIQAMLWGSGMYLLNSSPELNYITFSNNNLGAFYAESSSPKLNNIIVKGNKSGAGGVIHGATSTITAKNIAITGNIGGNGSGGLVYGRNNNHIYLHNATISGNYAQVRTPIVNLVASDMSSTTTIYNSVIWGNNEKAMGTLSAASSNNYIEGNANFHGNESLTTADFFVAPAMATSTVPTVGGNFRLKPSSPLINAGNNTLFTGLDGSTTDIAGYKRVKNYETSGVIDVGANESFENTAPTAIALTVTTVNENVPVNTAIGQFSATDADGGNMIYALVTGTGDIDNSSFVIDGKTLKILSSPDYEAKNTYSIRVQVTDADGLTYQQQFAISINNVAETGQANVITFTALPNKTYGNASFDLIATASSNLEVTYSSSDPSVAKIEGKTVTILKAGFTDITASQAGSETYAPATDVVQRLTVDKRTLNLTSSAKNKAYDGNNNASVTFNDDRLDNEELMIRYESATFSDATIGDGKTVTISNISLDGGSVENYQLAVNSLTTTANIVNVKVKSLALASAATNYSELTPLIFEVQFHAPIVVTGSPQLNFVISGGTKSATYVSGSGTTKLRFSYTPANIEGHGLSNLALDLNGGSLKTNADGFDLDLDLSAISTSFSDIFVDAIPLQISNVVLKSSNANPQRAKVGDEVTLTFSLGLVNDLPVVKIAGHDVTATNLGYQGNAETLEGYIMLFKASYTLTATDLEGTVAFRIDAKDPGSHTAAYNSADHATAVSFDKTKPTVTFTTTASDPAGAIIPMTATFSENITGLDAADFDISNGTITNISGSGNSYTFDVNVTANGFVMFTILENKLMDAAGNLNDLSTRFGMPAIVTIDQTISFTSPGDKTYGDGAFELHATASSSLPVTYVSSDPTIVSITDNMATILKAGSVTITAKQAGNASYNAASADITLQVNKKQITATAENKTKVFGDTDPSLTVSIDANLVGSDSFTGSLIRTAGDHAGSYEIKQGSLALSDNYALTFVAGQFTIAKRGLNITAVADDKEYNGSRSGNPRITSSDLPQGWDIGVLPYANFDNKNVGTNKPVTINLSIAFGANKNDFFVINPVINTTASITPAPLNLTVNSNTKVYGDNDPELTYEQPELLDDDVLTGKPSRTTGEGVGAYKITVGTLNSNNNYAISINDAALTITPKSLTVTAQANNKNFDGNTNATVTFSDNRKEGDVFDTNYSSASFIDPTVGNGKTVTVTGISISGGASSNYVLANTTASTIANINEGTIVGVSFNDGLFTYDGTAKSIAVSGLPSGATVTYVGNNKAAAGTHGVTATVKMTGHNDLILNANITIAKANLTITANDASKTYDATAYSGGNGVSYSGFVGSDNSSSLTGTLSYTGTSQGATDAGSYIIAPDGLTSNNYNISFASGALTINKANLTVTANDASKTYDATAYSGGNGVSYSGFVGSDNGLTLNGALSYTGNSQGATNAGSYVITPDGLTSNNYNISFADGTLSINKANLTVTANDASKTYDATAYSGGNGVSYSGFVGSDNGLTLNGALSYTGNSQGATDAGSYVITPDGLTSNNYNISFADGTLSINKANLTVTANDASKTYDATAYSGGNGVSYSGFVGSDNSSSLTGTLSYTGTSQGATNAGSYVIAPDGLTSNNYNISFRNGLLTINKANARIILSNLNQIYDGSAKAVTVTTDPAGLNGLTVSYDGSSLAPSAVGNYLVKANLNHQNYMASSVTGTLVIGKLAQSISFNNLATRTYGDGAFDLEATSSSGLPPSYTSSNPLVASVSGSTVTIHKAGTTLITAVQSGNLTYNAANTIQQTLTINPKTLTITAEDQTKAYGAAMPPLTVFYNGFVNGDDVSKLNARATVSTSATINSAVGNYALSASGAMSENYTINYVQGNLKISPATISVTAEAKTKIYGDVDPLLTYTFTGTLAAGDSFSGNLSRGTGENVGSYGIDQGTLTLNTNYALVYNSSNLVISPAQLLIAADHKSRTYLQANPVFTVSYSGFKRGDNSASLGALPITGTTATIISTVGTYNIVPSGAVATNYTINYQNGTLSITPADRTLTFAGMVTKTFGDADFAPGATLSSGEIVEYSSSNTAVATIVNGKIHITGAGATTITASAPINQNYNPTSSIQQQLTVNKAQQTIAFSPIPEQLKGSRYDLSGVISSSGLPISFTTGDAKIATVSGTTLNTLAIGSTSVTATAMGNANYLPALEVTRTVKIVDIAGAEVIVRKAVSPNGDGINDFLYIEGVKDYPQNKVVVMNRNGVKIAEINNYDNSSRVFDGRSNVNGQVQAAGTYFYMIEAKNNGKVIRETGYFILKYTN